MNKYQTGTSTVDITTNTSNYTISGTNTVHAVFKKAPRRKARKRTNPTVKAQVKDFWDGVEWKPYTSYIPRKSITGKIIIGKMFKRWRTPAPMDRGKGLGVFKQFAKQKELFQEKLKGKA
jgi:hypothetical protein